MLLPQLMPTDTCKAMAYICKTLVDNHTVVHHPNHPLAMPNSIVLDIFEDPTLDNMPLLQVINVYHPPSPDHSLGYLFQHHINDTTPTLLIGDFNTHSPHWSIEGKTLSQWASAFRDWMDNNGLHCLNEPGAPTWFGSREDDMPSILDLTITNEAAIFRGQLSALTISHSVALRSDHVVILLKYYPITSIALLPPPAPKGYRANNEQ